MKSILLVEDDPLLIDIYSQKMGKAGFKVESAKSGQEALKFLKDKKPDLLILDIVLPEMEGWSILKTVKEDPKFQDLKVIILSNLGEREAVEKGLRLGAMKYLIKAHYTPSEVVDEIKGVLK